jgi:hypothetical protein
MIGRLAVALACGGLLVGIPARAAPLIEIGTTVTVRNSVMVEYEADRHRLDRGDSVHQNEAVQTSRASQAEIRLMDETKLAVGPDSRVVLDTFVYDARATPGTTAVRMAKGAFRFISGNNPSSTYQVLTPSAAIGVRGTVFDVNVTPALDTWILLHQGVIEVCTTPTNCRVFSNIGGMVHVTSDGVISFPQKWENKAVRGASVESAFPFVGRALEIDPTPRLRHAVLLRPYRPMHPEPRPSYPKGTDGTGSKSRTGDAGPILTKKVPKKSAHVDQGTTRTTTKTKLVPKTPQTTTPKLKLRPIHIPRPNQTIIK